MNDQTNIFEMSKERFRFDPSVPVRLFESFAGIGCQRMALDFLGLPYESVGISEIDKYAIKSYMAIHGETKNFGNIMDIKGSDLPEIDIFTFSFPCTDLSKAGKQRGLGNTRSGLVYEVLRILHECEEHGNLPKVLIMENVIDLIQAKFVRQFNGIQHELEQIGYTNYVQDLNGKNYGTAQNRDRVFMVSILGDYYYEFPKPFPLEKRLKDYLEKSVDQKYFLSDRLVRYFVNNSLKNEKNGNGFRFKPHSEDAKAAYALTDGTCNRMDDNFVKIVDDKYSNREDREYDECSPSLTAQRGGLKVVESVRIGGVFDNEKGKHQAGSVWDVEHLSPTLDTMQGGHRQPCISIGNTNPSGNGMNGNVWLGDVSPTLTTNKGEGMKIAIPDNSNKGYSDAYEGDGVYIDRPHQKRGTVQEQKSPTIKANGARDIGVVVEKNAKTELCNKLLRDGDVKEGDMIRHSYTTSRMEDEKARIENNEGISATLTTRPDTLGIVVEDDLGFEEHGGDEEDYQYDEDTIIPLSIRKLTPRECWRLMEIPDEYFDRAKKVNSDAQLYKQAGNGIIVKKLAYIIEKLFY